MFLPGGGLFSIYSAGLVIRVYIKVQCKVKKRIVVMEAQLYKQQAKGGEGNAINNIRRIAGVTRSFFCQAVTHTMTLYWRCISDRVEVCLSSFEFLGKMDVPSTRYKKISVVLSKSKDDTHKNKVYKKRYSF